MYTLCLWSISSLLAHTSSWLLVSLAESEFLLLKQKFVNTGCGPDSGLLERTEELLSQFRLLEAIRADFLEEG